MRDLVKHQPDADQVFKPRDSWWYFERGILGREKKGTQGASYFLAPNPPYGTTFTYYLKDSFESLTEKRQKAEKKAEKEGKEIDFPGWDKLDAEILENKPANYLYITSENGEILNRLQLANKKGLYRVTWNHKRFSKVSGRNYFGGPKVAPGNYKAYVARIDKDGKVEKLSETIDFKVKRLYQSSLPGKNLNEVAAFWQQFDAFNAKVNIFTKKFRKTKDALETLQKATLKAGKEQEEVYKNLLIIKKDLEKIAKNLYGRKSKNEVGEKNDPGIFDRINHVRMGIQNSSYGPTPGHLKSYKIAQNTLQRMQQQLANDINQLISIEKSLKKAGIPYIDTGLCPDSIEK